MANTKYKKKYAEDLIAYFLSYYEMEDAPKELMEEDVDGVFRKIPSKPSKGYPTLTKFAIMKGVTPRTLTNWKNNFPKFAEACDLVEGIYNDILEERALKCTWDSKSCIKILELHAAAKRAADEELGNHIQITFKNLTRPALELKEQEGVTDEDTGYIDEH